MQLWRGKTTLAVVMWCNYARQVSVAVSCQHIDTLTGAGVVPESNLILI